MTEPDDQAAPASPEVDDTIEDLQQEVANLHTALLNARVIGIALGILIERHKVTEVQAFELIRTVSSHRNRKLRDVAADLVLTGVLDETRPSA